MIQKSFTFLRLSSFAALMAVMLALPHYAQAQDATEEAPAATEEAAEKPAAAPAAAKAVAKEAAPAAEKEKPLSEQEKKAAIEAIDGITAFDPAKAIGLAKDKQIYYQEPSTETMTIVEHLHDAVLVIITLIVILVLGLMIYVCLRFNKRTNPKPQTFTHNKLVEIVWTVIPILILVGIAIPSIRIHYNYYNNEQIIDNPDLTLKIVGHQWYWEYEYPDHGIKFDSNITPEKDLPEGAPRLLEVDNAVVVPVGKVVRVQLTAADVIHAWVIPSFGVKKGAIPGRLNETWFKAEKEGIYYGQCSVLCGKLHGFMPIKVVVVSQDAFDQWVKGAKLKFASNNAMQFAALN